MPSSHASAPHLNPPELTCTPSATGSLQFSNGCGGLAADSVKWRILRTDHPCSCRTTFGNTLYDTDGALVTASECAQVGRRGMGEGESARGVVSTCLNLGFAIPGHLLHVWVEPAHEPVPVQRHSGGDGSVP